MQPTLVTETPHHRDKRTRQSESVLKTRPGGDDRDADLANSLKDSSILFVVLSESSESDQRSGIQMHCTAEYTRYSCTRLTLFVKIYFFTIFRFRIFRVHCSLFFSEFVFFVLSQLHKQPMSERSDFKNVREHSKCQQKMPTFSPRRKVFYSFGGLHKLFHHKE